MERVMSELLTYFAEKKELELHLVLYGISREVFYAIPESINIYTPDFGFNSKFRIWSAIKTLVFLRKTIMKIDPVSILSFGEYWNSFVLLGLLGAKIPVYISDRAQPGKNMTRIHRLLRKALYPKAAALIAQTERAREINENLRLNNNIVVIGNPIRNIAKVNDKTRENIVLMVARLIKSKRHDLLIKIFAKAATKDWKLVLVGYDHLKQQNEENLKRLSIELGIENQVVFAGKTDNVEDHYNKAKIFAFTSESEGFPNVIGEAMSAGLPVVAFDCIAGPAELINNGKTGYLIPLYNEEEFKEKLVILMNDEVHCQIMGQAAKAVIQQFSIEHIGEKFYRLLVPSARC